MENTKIEVRCPSCNANYKIAADRIPDKGCHATCKCGYRMPVSKSVSTQKPVPRREKAPREAASKTEPPVRKKAQTTTLSNGKRSLNIAILGLLVLFIVAGAAFFLIHQYDIQITKRDGDTTPPIKKINHVITQTLRPITKQPLGQSNQETAASKPENTAADTHPTIGDLFNKESKATATVVTYDSGGNIFKQGSGFFINAKGHFITCFHVLEGAYSVYVKIEDKKEYKVDSVIAQDENRDLVKLAVDIPDGPLRPGMWLDINGKTPNIADKVLVISTPMGLSRTVSDGIISAVRGLPTKAFVYQMTAPISPGSSGSPVIDMKGKVIGVSFLQIVNGQNLNFAIPAKYILELKNETPVFVASWSENVSREKNDAFNKIQEGILLQIDPNRKDRKNEARKKASPENERLRADLAHQIVKESGIDRQNISFSASTLASFEKKYKEKLKAKTKKSDDDEGKFKKFKEIIKLVTNPDKYDEYIDQRLASNLSVKELKEVLKWYKSPLGKEISAIEYSSFSEKKEQLQKLRLAFNLTKYQSTDRLTLFRRLNRATKATDTMIELQKNLIVQDQILNLVLSNSKIPKQESINKIVKEYKKSVDPYLDTLTANLVFAGFVYTYRGVSKNDIEKYVLFSETTTAKHFYQVMNKQCDAYLLESHKRILTSIIRVIKKDSWANIKKDLNQPIAG